MFTLKTLTYLQAHQHIHHYLQTHKNIKTPSNQLLTRLITWSGRLQPWLESLTPLLLTQPKTTPTQALNHLKHQNLLQPLFQLIPNSEYPFLLQPATAPKTSWLKTHHLISNQRLFSPLFQTWLKQQSLFHLPTFTTTLSSPQENRLLYFLYQHLNQLVTRDDIAQTLWSDQWFDHYSDWAIDNLIHRLRQKLLPQWQLLTIRNQGYLFKPSQRQKLNFKFTSPTTYTHLKTSTSSILPSKTYLEYMNNPQNPRKTYRDLFIAVKQEHLPLIQHPRTILAINSYSFDNVDALAKQYPQTTAYFTNFDEQALFLHYQRIQQLHLSNFHAIYDDIRQTKLQPSFFDLVINDFRLNFNLNHHQDKQTLSNIHQLLKPQGQLLISVVVDARYESLKYGKNQEKAPLNLNRPWTFMGKEKLQRYCHTVPYYLHLFNQTGFKLIRQFDIQEGKTWTDTSKHTLDSNHRLTYRRFLIQK